MQIWKWDKKHSKELRETDYKVHKEGKENSTEMFELHWFESNAWKISSRFEDKEEIFKQNYRLEKVMDLIRIFERISNSFQLFFEEKMLWVDI